MSIATKKCTRAGWGLLMILSMLLPAGAGAEEAAKSAAPAAPPQAAAAGKAAPAKPAPPPTVDPETAANFIKAARFGQQDVVKSYLDHHLPLTVRDYLGNTALITAAGGGHADIVKELLAAGAAVNAENHEHSTALMAAALHDDTKLVKMLLDAGAKVDAKDQDGETALFNAVRYGHLGVVTLLLDAGADPNINNTLPAKSPESGYTPLMYAAKRGLVPSTTSVENWLTIIKMLLAKGAKPDARSSQGATALSVAQEYGNQDIANLLMKGGAKEALSYKGLSLNESLIMAASHGDAKEVVESLVAGADPEAKNRAGVTPLLAAAYGGSVDAVKAIMSRGANVNRVTVGFRAWTWTGAKIPLSEQALARAASLGDTALILAAQMGHEAVVAYLLDHGADPKLANPHDDTPLSVAAEQGHDKIVAMLLATGIDPNEGQRSVPAYTADATIGILPQERNPPLCKAAQGGYEKTVKVLLEKGADPDVRGFAGKTALFSAVERGYADVVNLLLDHHADPNIRSTAGESPLMEAAKAGNVQIVRALVAHHADLDAREGDEGLPGTVDVSAGTGMTPLMMAVVGGHRDVVSVLLDAGADTSIRNRNGETALDEAMKGQIDDIIGLLRDTSVSAVR
ncbi:MAG: ankyrin repeat domain-containing protein [Gammaproteobacteria bacterium]